MTQATEQTGPFDGWRASAETEGPNGCRYYTAGIDTPQLNTFGKPDWHFHAICFHSKDLAIAEARRDLALAAPDLLKALELARKRIGFYGQISDRRHFDHDLKNVLPVIDAALAAAKGGL